MTSTSIYKTPAGEKAVMTLYDTLLDGWPVPYEKLTIPTRHGSTFVITSGEPAAPPLVLLHGAGANSAVWAGDVVEYSRHYRVYAVDLLGEPGKSAPNRPAWDSPAYAEWLEDVFDALKIDAATLIGISQGGWTALKFTAHAPGRVNRLVLMTPGGVVPGGMSFLVKVVLFSLLGERGIRRMVRSLFGSQPIPDGVEDIIVLIMRNFKPRVGILPIFSDQELQRLTMPTLLLGGTQDVLFNLRKIAARMQGLVPHLEVIIIPGAGHALLNTTGHVMSFLTTAAPALSER
jgi:pimeloyl-ACP methyl ester carboxylesterase